VKGPSYFEIQAADVQRAVAFYKSVFGWRFTRAEGMPIEYWRIDTDGARGGVLQRPAPAPPAAQGTNAFVCSMEVADFATMAKRITDAGGTVALPKFAVPGVCWQGYFIDPEGNTFGIFQPDPAAK
jgi:predicted enzyme related to lactoylglutathione lyase